ncbi:TetR/AcrR family transcriptional regulator [Paenibacillus rigui]|uniref:TetR family transcriptional regulator n=1 Tax=Paenibacillus rigui TaxID=554312 RepID=A0A229ULY8_9BACL|nr:TetR/AcrR family transcriptional regulator [Paenibacillus rigui]OXM84324.1 TetR family transcriptional regulator [Paenibacillus rigui]
MTNIQQLSTNPSFLLLLEAAEQLILEKGCRSTTLQDIINRTGLSKGAIYHYVSSKDELFGLILQTKMELMNQRFHEAVQQAAGTGENSLPFHAIAEGLAENSLEQSVLNTIFIYLLSHKDQPKIAAILEQHQTSVYETVLQWIRIGQQARVIPAEADASKIASMYIVFSYGLRVQQQLNPAVPITTKDIFNVILRPGQKG